METSVRTIWSLALQSTLLQNTKYEHTPYSTLNEFFNVLADTPVPAGEIPTLKYMAFGCGGHRSIDKFPDGDSQPPVSVIAPVPHRATDAMLYRMLPMVIRDKNNDLEAGDRAKYAMRTYTTINSVDYIVYWLRRIDTTKNTVNLERRHVDPDTQIVTATPFVPNSDNLKPVPPDLTGSGVNITSGDYVTATSKHTVVFTEQEIKEVINACQIMYGMKELAFVTEVAFCSGIDKIVSHSSPNIGTFNFLEATHTQVLNFFYTLKPLLDSTESFTLNFDIGGSEPLLRLGN